MNSQTYSRPILSRIFDLFACLAFIGGGICIIGVIASAKDNGITAVAGMVPAVACFLVGIIYVGIGQVIDYLAQTAFNTGKLVTLGEAAAIATQAAALSMTKAGSASSANFYYSVNGSQEGPFSAHDMRQLRTAKTVRPETPVVREGDTEWRTFDKYPELLR